MNKMRIYAIVIVIVALVFAFLIYTNFSTPSNSDAGVESLIGKPVPQSVVSMLNISTSLSNRIGAGTIAGFPTKITNATPLVNGTKPEVLYIGAEYCPYCAVTRWGLIIALMRFGQFSNLHYMASNATDVYGDTPTFTFVNSTYQSNYISFVSVETQARNRAPLQNPTDAQNYIFGTYNPSGGIPFIDFGNLSFQSGASADAGLIYGHTWNYTLANLTNTSSPISQSIIGNADIFTAEICKMTNFTPSSVCSQSYVTSIVTSMNANGG